MHLVLIIVYWIGGYSSSDDDRYVEEPAPKISNFRDKKSGNT